MSLCIVVVVVEIVEEEEDDDELLAAPDAETLLSSTSTAEEDDDKEDDDEEVPRWREARPLEELELDEELDVEVGRVDVDDAATPRPSRSVGVSMTR